MNFLVDIWANVLNSHIQQTQQQNQEIERQFFIALNDAVEAFMQYATNLISANGTFIEVCFSALVKGLLPSKVEVMRQMEGDQWNEDYAGLDAESQGKVMLENGRDPAVMMLTGALNTRGGLALSQHEQTRLEYVHKCIKAALNIVPLAVNNLFTQIVENFPHKRHDPFTQRCFLVQTLCSK